MPSHACYLGFSSSPHISCNLFDGSCDVIDCIGNLLEKYGKICDDVHSQKILGRIKDFIQSLCANMSVDVETEPVLAGSMREGTRVMEASEGDFVLEMLDFPDDIFETPEETERPFLRLKRIL